MFWDAFTVGLVRDARWLLGLGVAAILCLVIACVITISWGKNNIKYYCDLKRFFFFLFGLFAVIGVGFVALHLSNSQKMVSLKSEFKTAEDQQMVRELCQHEFEEDMKAAKTEQKKNAIKQKLEDNGIKVVDNNGKKELKFAPDAKISRWQADWVQLRAKLEEKLGRRITAPWEKKKDSKKLSLNEKLNQAALKFVYRVSVLRIVAWGIVWGIICLIVLIFGFVTGTKGTPEKVQAELLGE